MINAFCWTWQPSLFSHSLFLICICSMVIPWVQWCSFSVPIKCWFCIPSQSLFLSTRMKKSNSYVLLWTLFFSGLMRSTKRLFMKLLRRLKMVKPKCSFLCLNDHWILLHLTLPIVVISVVLWHMHGWTGIDFQLKWLTIILLYWFCRVDDSWLHFPTTDFWTELHC